MKILLADDSMTAQNMGKKILTDAGFDVIAVSNGAAALKKITTDNPDIIILDVFMPGYTGLEVCERLKNNPETSRKPVLLTVGKMEPFNPEDSNRVRAEGVMIKPFEATDLTAAIEAIAKRFNLQNIAAPPPPPPAPPAPKLPENYRSYEETVRLSQQEMQDALGIGSEGMQSDAATSAASVATAAETSAAVAVAMAPIEIESSAVITEATAPSAELPELESAPAEQPKNGQPHTPFSRAEVAQAITAPSPAPEPASEPAAWDPVLDGIAIPADVIAPVTKPETVAAATPAFGMDEYVVPASVAQEIPAIIEEQKPAFTAEAAHLDSLAAESQVSPNAYLADASAAMGLETSHVEVESEPHVESTPGFEPNVAPPVVVETHAESGVEPGIEQPAPETSIARDPALTEGTESFTGFATRFGVENPEEIPVGIVPELMPDASSSYEYLPPEEGHTFEGEAEPVAATEEAKAEAVASPAQTPHVSSLPQSAWEMVPAESELVAELERVVPAPIADAPVVEETKIEAPVAEAAELEPVSAEPESLAEAAEAEPAAFDPDATQPIPEEFFTADEPQLETTAELAGAEFAAPITEPEPPQAEPESVELESQPASASTVPEIELPPVANIASEPSILSVGPEPSLPEEPVSPQFTPAPPASEPAIAAAAAAGASALGSAISEQVAQALEISKPASESEEAPGDQTQVFIASAVARVLDRMKPTLIEEIAREMSNRRKPRKDPEE